VQIVSDSDLDDREVLDFLAEQESQDIRPISDFTDRLLERIENPAEVTGITTPWPKMHFDFRLRPAEVSVWFGRSGHFKSALVNQIALYATNQVRVGIQSFEMDIETTLERMVRQAAGTANPPKSYVRGLTQKLSERMWLYDRLDMVPPHKVIACVHHMAKLGIGLVVIDPLILIKGVTRDAEKEAAFMARLIALAKAHKIHIALVHHPRKEKDNKREGTMPTRDDMRGASDIGDMASTIVILHHNKRKAEALRKQAKGLPLDDKDLEAIGFPDHYMRVDKQRNGEFEGTYSLAMNRQAFQFTESETHSLHIEVPA